MTEFARTPKSLRAVSLTNTLKLRELLLRERGAPTPRAEQLSLLDRTILSPHPQRHVVAGKLEAARLGLEYQVSQ